MVRYLGFALIVVLTFVSLAIAGNGDRTPVAQEDGQVSICVDASAYGGEMSKDLARRGCCSWHGGVCGCRNGRTVCCDGSLSPSCTCAQGEVEVGDGG